MAAITSSAHVTIASGTDTNTYVSSTYTPTSSGRLVLIGFAHSASSSPADLSSITGASLSSVTKILTLAYNTISTQLYKIELWAALSTSSASTVSFNLPATNTGGAWDIMEMANVDTSKGTLGIVTANVASNRADSGTAVSATLAGFQDSHNGAVAVIGANGNPTIPAKSGWTQDTDVLISPPNQHLGTQWIATNDTAPGSTLSVSNAWAIIAAELWSVDASSGGSPYTVPSAKHRHHGNAGAQRSSLW